MIAGCHSYAPPFHPRCGCDLVPVTAGNEEAPEAPVPFDQMEKAGGDNPWHGAGARFTFAPETGRDAAPQGRFRKHHLAVKQFANRLLHVGERTAAHRVGPV